MNISLLNVSGLIIDGQYKITNVFKGKDSYVSSVFNDMIIDIEYS